MSINLSGEPIYRTGPGDGDVTTTRRRTEHHKPLKHQARSSSTSELFQVNYLYQLKGRSPAAESPADSTCTPIPPSTHIPEHEKVPVLDSTNIHFGHSSSSSSFGFEPDQELPSNSTNTQLVPSSSRSSSIFNLEHEAVTVDSPNDQVATSSSNWEHDVFLSFRGEDTRYAFTDHLYYAMHQRGIDTFRDTEKLQRGKSISPELLKAIEESKFAVTVLSINYATSTWCLDELAHILECKKLRGLEVLPVFYHVEPSEIRRQTGIYGKAFAKHETDFKDNIKKVNKWREALKEIASLSGWHVTKDSGESEVIQDIAKRISNILNNTLSNPDRDLIGMDERIEKMESYLDLRSDDICTIGIWGMGGIGKTTLAKEVFKKIRNQFDTSGFVSEVRLHSEGKALVELQRLLCGSFFGDSNINIDTVGRGIRLLKKVLRKKKVLIVLDDVDELKQLKDLAPGKHDEENSWGPGSRLMITTRDRRTLTGCGVLEDKIYEVEKLSDAEAFQLMSQKAFKENYPPSEFVELLQSFVQYASGLPLAHKVLGSYLSGRNINEWSEALDRLDEDPDKDIFSVLQISFDGLRDTDKKIFLDIACFFNGEDHVRVKNILKGCGFCPEIGITDLINKSLIKIERKKLWMHDLLQQLGWHIVRRESPFPGNRSRLWLNDGTNKYEGSRSWRVADTRDALTENTGTAAVEGLFLNLLEKEEMCLTSDPFLNMRNLRLLKICNVNFLNVNFTYLSKRLRFLEWHECPLEILSSCFEPDQLVEFKMPNSHIKHLWNERLYLEMLVCMDLSDCQYLTKTLDFSKVPKLQRLILKGCKALLEVHQTIGDLKHLVFLNLKGCESLENLPQSIRLRSLQTFILSGCSKLRNLPDIGGNMDTLSELCLDGTAILELPVSIQRLGGLTLLNLSSCKNLLSLPSVLCSSLTSLKFLYLSLCSSMEELPENIGCLKHLEELDVCDTAIKKVPNSISGLKNLKLLCFHGCSRSVGLELPNLFSGLRSLTTLNLGRCNLAEGAIPGDIGELSSLQSLDLSENNFSTIPQSISKLSELTEISLFRCSNLQSLPEEFPSSLRNVNICSCHMPTNSSDGWRRWASQKGLSIINCRKPEEDEHLSKLPELPKFPLKRLQQLNLSNCQHLTKIPELNEIPHIQKLILEGCEQLSEVHPTIGSLRYLVLLNLKGCTSLESLPQSINLRYLRTFILSGCSKLREFPEIMVNMDSLSELYLDGTALRKLPVSIQQLKGLILLNVSGCRNLSTVPVLLSLKSLNLSGCSRISRLPIDLGRMEHLEKLDASETAITEVPYSILYLEKLKVLSFCGCFGLQLPNWFSNLRSLRSLNLRRCGLPENVHDRLFWLTSLQSLDLGENNFVSIPNEIGRLSSLQRLDFSGNNLVSIANEIGCLSSLQCLDLSENNFVSIPESISQLSELTELRLFRCSKLKSLPRNLPFNLKHVNARECPMLKNNADTLTIWASGKRFCFINCGQSDQDNDQPSHVPVPEDSIGLLFSKYIQDRIYGKKPFEFRFPHSARIPQFWSHWRSGPYVAVPLSDSNGSWIGLALFVVFEILEIEKFDNRWESEETICEFHTSFGRENSLVFQNFLDFRTGSYGLCCYEPRGGQFGGLFDEPLLQASVSTKRPDLKVRGCGLHLISEHDAAAFVQNLINQTAIQHLDFNFDRHCEEILEKATICDLIELDPDDLWELGSSSTVNEDDCRMSSCKIQLRAQLSILYEGRNGCEKSFHVCLPDSPNIMSIPTWFINRQAGDVTLCYISENLFADQRWVGLELYVVFARRTPAPSDGHINSFFFHVELCGHDNGSLIMHGSLKRESCLGESNQLLVLHLPRVYFQEQLNQCQVISALFTTSTPELEVIVCGSRLVYQQDLKDLIHSLTAAASTFGEHVLTQLCSQACTQTDDQIIAVKGEMAINCDSSFQSRRSTAQLPEQVLTSIMRLESYRCYLRQKQVFVESEPTPLVHSGSVIPVHAKGCLLEYRESNSENVAEENTKSSLAYCHHLRIMAETQLYGSYSSFQLKTSLQLLLQHSKVATLSLGGHTISSLKNFDPSSACNIICFSDKEIPVWFKHEMSYQLSSRSRVGIKLPPKLQEDGNWRGLAICVAFEVHDQRPTASPVKLLCHLRAKDSYCLNPIPMCSITEEKLKSLHVDRFIWLSYIPRVLLTEFNVVSDVEARIYVGCKGLTVEKCGMRLLYRQEEGEFESAITECWTSFFDNLSFIRRLVEADDQNVQPWTRHELPMLEGHIKVFDPDILYNAIPTSTEIPKWFGHPINAKDDYAMNWYEYQLPPSLSDKNWIGLAICASHGISRGYLVERHSYPFILTLKTGDNGLSSLHRYQMTNEESEFLKRCCNVHGEFIWLSYIPRRWFLHQLNDESVLTVSSSENSWKPRTIYLRFVYAHEVEEFKQLCFNLHRPPAQQ